MWQHLPWSCCPGMATRISEGVKLFNKGPGALEPHSQAVTVGTVGAHRILHQSLFTLRLRLYFGAIKFVVCQQSINTPDSTPHSRPRSKCKSKTLEFTQHPLGSRVKIPKELLRDIKNRVIPEGQAGLVHVLQ